MVTGLKSRLSYHRRLFLLLLLFSWTLVTCFVLFQYGREKHFKAEQFNARLQLLNLRMLDAVDGGTSPETFVARQGNAFGDLRVTVRTMSWSSYTQALRSGNYDLYYAECRLTADWDLTPLLAAGGALTCILVIAVSALNLGGIFSRNIWGVFRSSVSQKQAVLVTNMATGASLLISVVLAVMLPLLALGAVMFGSRQTKKEQTVGELQ